MQKVLLIIEDYNELLFSETLLKKIGVDSLGLKSDAGVTEEAASFRPQLAIVSDYGPRQSAKVVCPKIKKASPNTLVLVLYRGEDPEEEDILAMDADGAIKSPFHPKQLIDAVAHMTETDPKNLLAKFEKLSLFKEPEMQNSQTKKASKLASSENITHLKGSRDIETSSIDGTDFGDYDLSKAPRKRAKIFNHMEGEAFVSQPTPDESKKREEKFDEYLSTLPAPEQEGFSKESTQKWTKEIRKIGEGEDNIEFDEKRRDFVRALYKK